MDAYNVGSRPKKRKRLGVDNFENDDEAHREANPSQPASCMNEVDGKILLKCPNHAAEVLTGLERLLQDKRLCDVIVQVGDSEFHAHRVVLAASSDMLRALLIGGWKETDEKVLPSAPPRHIASDSIFFRQGPHMLVGRCVDEWTTNGFDGKISACSCVLLSGRRQMHTLPCTVQPAHAHKVIAASFPRL
jgi:hypothetical protein